MSSSKDLYVGVEALLVGQRIKIIQMNGFLDFTRLNLNYSYNLSRDNWESSSENVYSCDLEKPHRSSINLDIINDMCTVLIYKALVSNMIGPPFKGSRKIVFSIFCQYECTGMPI